MRVVAPLRLVGDGGSWAGLLFLASRMPLGLVYFVLPAGLGLLGLALAPVAGAGAPILVAALGVAWALAAFERRLGRWWLGVDARVARRAPAGSRRRALRAFLADPLTWKSLAYLLLQLPLGALVFALFAGAAAAALALMVSPVAYVLFVVVPRPADLDVAALVLRLALALGGVGVALLALAAARPAARGYGLLLETLLGTGRDGEELARARERAAEAEARAEAAERKRRELIMSMSHELRTPAASIRGHAEALLDPDQPLAEEERRRFLEVLAREAERVGSLTDELLSIARADAGELRLDLGPVDLGAVVAQVHAAMTPIAGRDREITLTARVEPATPLAHADECRVTQVLMNLVRNAITHTPDGGIVAIRLGRAGDRVALAVEDTGAGIAPEDQARVFERFYRADASRSRTTGGFGLGLAISRDLVEAMGGTIELASRPGQGSRFTVLLRRAG